MITIVMPISRPTFLTKVFNRLELMTCDREEVNLLTYVDGDLQLFELARNLTVKSKFAQRLCLYRGKGMPNVGSIIRRRQRIADIHNELKGEIQSAEFIMLIEDDTLVPFAALSQLLKDFDEHPNAGIISALEIGRWGYNHIGAWHVDDIYDPKVVISPAPGVGLEEVDATGMYCALVKKSTYMRHTFKAYENALGPDFNFGLTLRQEGQKNYLDHSLKCTHLLPGDKELMPDVLIKNNEIIRVKLEKDITNKNWRTERYDSI